MVSSASNVGGGGGGVASGSDGAGGMTTNSGSRPRSRSSTDPGSELGRDLLGGRPKGVDQHQADGGIEAGEQPVGGSPDVVAGDLGGGGQLPVEGLDVGCQLHDVSMTSS